MERSAGFPLHQLPKKLKEEVDTDSIGGNKFPLHQLPKKLKVKITFQSQEGAIVSITSTSEEAKREEFISAINDYLNSVSITSTSEEAKSSNRYANGNNSFKFPLHQLPKKLKVPRF